ncbi:MAG: hypothetical protein LBQ42_13640 [Synergistaceae bacterium]|jgi:hypothetical protein|nr:hypothetical protein [Synergistaceae bacterium]
MDNTSATGGILRESGAITRIEIENLWQNVISQISGLPGNLVRPAFQEDPGPTPGSSATWAAFQVMNGDATNYPVEHHYGEGDGESVVYDQTAKNVLVSIYGPGADDVADMIRRALHIRQNRDALRASGVAVTWIDAPIQLPELVNEKWLRRVDLTIRTTIDIAGAYQILNLLRADGVILADVHTGNQLKDEFDTDRVREHAN